MDISAVLDLSCVCHNVEATSKKRCLEFAANTLLHYDASIGEYNVLFDALINRERMGNTSFGGGIAIPHCRLESCLKPVAALMQLATPLDFGAPDNQPVDLMFVLVVPESATCEHLNILSALATQLEKPQYCRTLRTAQSQKQLYLSAVCPEEE